MTRKLQLDTVLEQPDQQQRMNWKRAKVEVLNILKQRAEGEEPGLTNAEVRQMTHMSRGQVKRLMTEIRSEGRAHLSGKGGVLLGCTEMAVENGPSHFLCHLYADRGPLNGPRPLWLIHRASNDKEKFVQAALVREDLFG